MICEFLVLHCIYAFQMIMETIYNKIVQDFCIFLPISDDFCRFLQISVASRNIHFPRFHGFCQKPEIYTEISVISVSVLPFPPLATGTETGNIQPSLQGIQIDVNVDPQKIHFKLYIKYREKV